MNMDYGKNGMLLTESFEKCRLTPYRDGGGVWTNGWGNTRHVDPKITITQDQADSDLMANVQDAADCVNDLVSVTLTQNQFDSLVDFVFNVGGGAFKSSTLLRRLNAGDIAGASAQFKLWNKIKGVASKGLDNRRFAETALFEKVQT